MGRRLDAAVSTTHHRESDGPDVRVVVMGGGESDERDVSSASAAAVSAALALRGHAVVEVDPARWPEPPQFRAAIPAEPPASAIAGDLVRRLRANLVDSGFWEVVREADLIFLALHGGLGESGHLQAACEVQQVRTTGASAAAVMNAWDKPLTLRLLQRAGVPVPRGSPVTSDAPTEELLRVLDKLGGDAIVKPIMGGSSIGISRVRSVEELQVGLLEAGGLGLVEERLTGAELTVSVVGDRVLAPVLINPGDGWFGYNAKYQPNASQELCPAPIARSLDQQLRDLALRAARAVGFDERDYYRVDFMQDSEGLLRCLEVNALPGLTPYSLLPLAARCEGWTFDELCERIVRLALRRPR